MRIALLVLLTGLFPLLAEDWTGFRGPDCGRSTMTNLPVTWSAIEGRQWSLALPGPGGSQPITYDGRIYVTAYSGYGEGRQMKKWQLTDPAGLHLHVLCLDDATGREIWHQQLSPLNTVESGSKLDTHGYATPSPVLEGETLYVSFGSAGVFAMDAATGTVQWELLPGQKTHRWGSAASLAVCDDLLLINASPEADHLIAVNKKTGEERWRNNEAMVTNSKYNRSWSTPMVHRLPGGVPLILLLNLNELCAYDTSGKTLWTVNMGQGYSASNPVIHDGILYGVTGSGHGTSNTRTITLDPSVNDKQRVLWRNEDNGSGFSSAVYVDGYLYYAAFSGKERPKSARGFCCMDAANGNIVYKVEDEIEQPLGKRRGSHIYASAMTGDGKIYYVSQTYGVFVLAAKPQFELLAVNTFEDDESIFNAPPVPLDDGRILFRSDWGLHCVQ
jgi:outer membrane protein assembly factor BamB